MGKHYVEHLNEEMTFLCNGMYSAERVLVLVPLFYNVIVLCVKGLIFVVLLIADSPCGKMTCLMF